MRLCGAVLRKQIERENEEKLVTPIVNNETVMKKKTIVQSFGKIGCIKYNITENGQIKTSKET